MVRLEAIQSKHKNIEKSNKSLFGLNISQTYLISCGIQKESEIIHTLHMHNKIIRQTSQKKDNKKTKIANKKTILIGNVLKLTRISLRNKSAYIGSCNGDIKQCEWNCCDFFRSMKLAIYSFRCMRNSIKINRPAPKQQHHTKSASKKNQFHIWERIGRIQYKYVCLTNVNH